MTLSSSVSIGDIGSLPAFGGSDTVADLTGWTTRKVQGLARDGKIPAQRFGKSYLFNIAQVVAALSAEGDGEVAHE